MLIKSHLQISLSLLLLRCISWVASLVGSMPKCPSALFLGRSSKAGSVGSSSQETSKWPSGTATPPGFFPFPLSVTSIPIEGNQAWVTWLEQPAIGQSWHYPLVTSRRQPTAEQWNHRGKLKVQKVHSETHCFSPTDPNSSDSELSLGLETRGVLRTVDEIGRLWSQWLHFLPLCSSSLFPNRTQEVAS